MHSTRVASIASLHATKQNVDLNDNVAKPPKRFQISMVETEV
jgi:hypothetical protein